ncbi:MAG: threonine--tRNA ligase [Sandaracinaceae bacterium]|nr:threonine--tRNA ligase [Sandaracinaceae bacterium]
MQSEFQIQEPHVLEDHRAIGRRLGLFHLQEEAPGMVFWHPRGWILYRALEEAARALVHREGYLEVRTPQVLARPIWEASGHWRAFPEGMLRVEVDEREAALKPVSCPGHVQIVERMRPSHRDLPLRLAELGLVHRDEARGALQGLFRLRQFTQDDGHVFCLPEQVVPEVQMFLRGVVELYRAFGFDDVCFALSTRPKARFGDDALWDRAEAELARALEGLGIVFAVQPGQGAFYGPKIELSLNDRAGRAWQCGTIQLDFVMPERFDLSYAGADGAPHRPAMLHRAVYGSLERFLAVLLEHHQGRLPAWLAPVQARVLPIGERHRDAARAIVAELAPRVRAELDEHASVSRRIVRAHDDGVPFVLVLGDRELASDRVALRHDDVSQDLLRADAIDLLVQRCARAA